MTQQSHYWAYTLRNTILCLNKNLYSNVYSKHLYTNVYFITAQTRNNPDVFNELMDKQTVVCPYNIIIFLN